MSVLDVEFYSIKIVEFRMKSYFDTSTIYTN